MGTRFEQEFVQQGRDQARTVEETLDAAWRVLRLLPRAELTRIRSSFLDAYYPETPPKEA